jgi:hypothetical protein
MLSNNALASSELKDALAAIDSDIASTSDAWKERFASVLVLLYYLKLVNCVVNIAAIDSDIASTSDAWAERFASVFVLLY